jgi:hypothetical protein
MEEFRRERKSSKHPVFGFNFEPWYLQKIRRNATHLTTNFAFGI